jgi:hypothetical protein
MRAFWVTIVLILAATSFTSASVLTGPITNSANGHIYYMLAPSSWLDAEAEAVSLGGHLVTINDALENQWVLDTFGSIAIATSSEPDTWLWLGFTDLQVESSWQWTTGDPVTYTNWGFSEPSQTSSGEDYAAMTPELFNGKPPGAWIDTTNSSGYNPYIGQPLKHMGVVEIVPEPATMGLLVLGGVALLRKRRAS